MLVDADRLRADLAENGAIGGLPDAEWGRTVLTGTDADERARDRFVDRLRDAGLAVRVDAVGNVVGRWTPPGADPDVAPVATGSHLDSVPRGGIFDGPLGVYGGLEAVRALQDDGRDLRRPVEVVSFTEEEGQRFGAGLLGSAVAAGVMSLEEARAVEADDGETLGEALDAIEYTGTGRLDAADWDAFVELHPEQGRLLERAGASAGVVTAITGLTRGRVTVTGTADHAGATPMDERRDALLAASEMISAVERVAIDAVAAESDSAVATVGRVNVDPGAPNVIPGSVRFSLDIRDVDRSVMERMLDRIEDATTEVAARRGVDAAVEVVRTTDPTPMADRIRDALDEAATAAGQDSLTMHSGAGHDTMHVARVTDAGMLFAPSEGGISHSPSEWTSWDDCAAATEVLARTIGTLAGK